MAKEKGLIITYTGEGKGKTTAALGLVLRAVGYKKKCLVIQFSKHWFTGELAGIKKLPGVKIIQGGKGFVGILGDRGKLEDHQKAASATLKLLEKEIKNGHWDVVVADEIIGAVSGKLLDLKKVVSLLTDKPEELDLILTGHHAPKEVIDLSDLVTEMKEVKHPFKKGILAKKGIDF